MTRRIVKIALASTTTLWALPALAQTSPDADDGATDTEIVVTAQKRTQTLIEVPQSVAVVGGELLENQQLTGIGDFQRMLPGLSTQQRDAGQSMLVLRGVTTGSANPTVSVYVDDTPFGASTGQSNAAALSGDFDTFDLDRVEVLRGPQGTLYGASSLGGVVRYITTAPKLGVFEGKAQAGVAAVTDGSADWSGNAALNVPLGDTLALRASGFYRRVGGYIDSSNTGDKDINKSESYGGRASLLFKPSDALSVRLSALLQNFRTNSKGGYDADPLTFEPTDTDPVSGDPVSGFVRADLGVDKTDIEYRLYNGTIDYDLGFATLTSVTSYGKLLQDDIADQTLVPVAPGLTLGDYAGLLYGATNPLGVLYSNRATAKKFTQELRLASADSDTLEWVIGGYYTREEGQLFQNYFPFDRATLALQPVPVGGFDNLVLAQLDSVYKEYAAFGSATFHASDMFDITAGGRWSHNTQDIQTFIGGALFGGDTVQDGHSSESVFTWSVAPRLELSDRVALYARVAKGFRPGGPNPPAPGLPDFFSTFMSDTLVSYELGLRGDTGDRTFSWDASVYYLDWKNIQIPVSIIVPNVGPVNFDGNGEGAKTYGVELTTTLRPTRGLALVTNFSYNGSKLKGDLADGSGLDGERLPITPEFAVNADLSYEWSLSDSATASVGINVDLVGDRVAGYDGAYRGTFGANPNLDGYNTVDLRAGIDFGQFNIKVYARNLFDSKGITNVASFGERPNGRTDC